MATDIKNWSSTAADNDSPPPDGAPEGMAPSGVNNVMRQMMKSVRDWYVDPLWVDFGYTYAYVASTQFKIAGVDVSADFPVGRRVRVVASTPGTIYGTISAVAFSTDTTVTVTFDSGSLSNEALAVSVLPTLGRPVTQKEISNAEETISSASTTNLGSKSSTVISITGTTTITSFGSSASTNNPVYFLRFTGALILTHNATSLILPGAANITTAAGDTAVAKYEGSGNWRVIEYQKANGKAVVETVTTQKSWSVVRQVFTSSGTYTPTAGMVYCDVEAQGGGGGGGGANQANAQASGGGAGGYARKIISAATIGASQTVTINSGGGGGSTAGGNGSTGGSVTFGAILTANGGVGGDGQTANTGALGKAGGTASGGDINKRGNGSNGMGACNGSPHGSNGGDSPFGGGGIGGDGGNGSAASGNGAGGGGAAGTSASGGAGTNGIVVVTEFIYA